MSEEKYVVYSREKFEHNTDPQRRCYNGAHFSSEWRWSAWAPLSHPNGMSLEDAEESVKGWRSIGRKTCEFKYAKVGEQP